METHYPWVDPKCKSENNAKNFIASSRKSERLSADCSNYSEVRNGDALMWGGCSCSLEASAQLCRAKVSLSVRLLLLWSRTQQEKANAFKLRRRRKLHGWPSSIFNFSVGLKFFKMLVRYLPEQALQSQVVSINYQDTTLGANEVPVIPTLGRIPTVSITGQHRRRGNCSKRISGCLQTLAVMAGFQVPGLEETDRKIKK